MAKAFLSDPRAWNEPYEDELAGWASELDLNRFRLAQCVSDQREESSPEDEDALYRTALITMAEETRSEIHRVLIEEFGGEANLFVSLWNTVESQRDEDAWEQVVDEPNEPPQAKAPEPADVNWLEDAEAILGDVAADKMSAYEWIDRGMPREH